MPLIVVIFLIIYVLVNVYVYRRGRRLLSPRPLFRRGFLLLFLLLSGSYLLGRLADGFFPDPVISFLVQLGAWWFGFLFYLFLLLLPVDLVRLLDRFFHFLPHSWKRRPRRIALLLVAAVGLIILAGRLNARSVRVRSFDLQLPSNCGREELNLVFISDLHLGRMVGREHLVRVVETIESLQPDLIILAGDIVDEGMGRLSEMGALEVLSRLQAPLGVYAVTGNHEYLVGAEEVVEYISRSGVVFLRDDWVRPDGSFTLVGREDLYREWKAGKGRKSFEELMRGVDPDCPVIMISHQPPMRNETVGEGVDILLSGHTHAGQLFPFNWITGIFFETDSGYYRKGRTHVYVSAGVGTWGPPIRVGNVPEVVQLKIEFTLPHQEIQGVSKDEG